MTPRSLLGLLGACASRELDPRSERWNVIESRSESPLGRNIASRSEDALVEGLGVDYVEQLDARPTPADLATPWRRIANPFAFGRAAREAGVEVHRDLSYAPHGRRGLLDVYTSEVTPASGAPVLLQVHGGGWTIGNKDQQGLPLMQHMAAKGWVCVAINYRLAPRDHP